YAVSGTTVTWDRSASGWRLPTEAEWELAARAGTSHRYAGTDDDAQVCAYANVADASAAEIWDDLAAFACDDAFPGLAHVGSLTRNALRLPDMPGNGWEWVGDGWSDPLPGGTDPAVAGSGASAHVHRGGSWRSSPHCSRLAERCWDEADVRSPLLGLRLARR